jgi:hypothetical protein
MEMMGRIFKLPVEAKRVIEGNREKIAFVRARAEKILLKKKTRGSCYGRE